jgi:glutathione S-transferase
MLRLHHAPLACSLASRLALAESGLPHEIAFVDTARGEHKSAAYLRINPRGQVPALETDDGVVTESTAILPHIADLAPEKRLLPPAGTFARAAAQSWLSFLSSTLHVALARAMFPPPGCDNPEARDAAMSRVIAAFQDIDRHLQGRKGLLDAFSACDLYLLVFGLWRAAPTFAGQLPAFPDLDRLQQDLLARPGLTAIVAEEMQRRASAAHG